jgi:hypothetical protein
MFWLSCRNRQLIQNGVESAKQLTAIKNKKETKMSDKKNILFWPDINYEPGHWRPVLSMAQKVRDDMGHNIKFLCTPECKEIITGVKRPNGRRLFSDNEIITILGDLFPIGYSALANAKPEEARSRIDHCLRIAKGEFDKFIQNDAKDKYFKPDLLIAGYFISMEALLIQYRYSEIYEMPIDDPSVMKLIITTTFLRHPSEDPAITSLRFLAHHAQEHSSKLMRAAAEIKEEDTSRFNGSFSSIEEFIQPLEDVVELITCPEDLDHDHFKSGHRKNTHYVEPCILDMSPNLSMHLFFSNPNNNPYHNSDLDPDTALDIILGHIPSFNFNLVNPAVNKNPAYIYATAGSRVRDYVESARTMFKTLQEMITMPEANHRKLEMAVGYTLEEEFASTGINVRPGLIERITAMRWVDQNACLKRAWSAVIHGGLASIKECIYFGVRPIVIPFGKDQMDNALRVINKEVGSMIMLGGLTEKGLYDTIMDAEGCADIQKSLSKMRAKFLFEENFKRPSLEHIRKALGPQPVS